MKKVVLIICLFLSVSHVFAQRPEGRKGQDRGDMIEKMQEWTPEQRAALKTKRMTLDLDLSEQQQQQIQTVLLEAEKNRPSMDERKERMEKRKDISSEELYQKSMERLDAKIAMKAKFKEILTDEQFEKFEKSHKRQAHAKRSKGMRHGRK